MHTIEIDESTTLGLLGFSNMETGKWFVDQDGDLVSKTIDDQLVYLSVGPACVESGDCNEFAIPKSLTPVTLRIIVQ